mmetsp:Transcript_10152/g.15878  ORF Transcript_10152/g.15878 Transcript_10152/m.15878 type:complete len:206 (-) Transcript_10152:208-825(-)
MDHHYCLPQQQQQLEDSGCVEGLVSLGLLERRGRTKLQPLSVSWSQQQAHQAHQAQQQAQRAKDGMDIEDQAGFNAFGHFPSVTSHPTAFGAWDQGMPPPGLSHQALSHYWEHLHLDSTLGFGASNQIEGRRRKVATGGRSCAIRDAENHDTQMEDMEGKRLRAQSNVTVTEPRLFAQNLNQGPFMTSSGMIPGLFQQGIMRVNT